MKKVLIATGIAALAFVSVAGAQGVAITANLQVGSTGAQVSALQSALISMGYNIPSIASGAAQPGYFGAQTKTAVQAYQAARGIPSTGFVGPLTRAALSGGVAVVTPGPVALPCPVGYTCVPSGGGAAVPGTVAGLNGGEASLESFELTSEETSGSEGESNVEIATAEFDVEDSDVRIERMVVDFQAEDTSDSVRPWEYFDSVSVWSGGKMIKQIDVDSRSDWDEEDDDSDHGGSTADFYRLTFSSLNLVARAGSTAEITIAANIAGTIDSDDITQEFTVLIPTSGIRATDAAGIQQYTGSFNEVVDDFGFDAEESGDLDLETNSSDPDTMTLISDEDDESSDYTVFVFDIENNDNVDTEVTDLTFTVATSSGDAIGDILDSATLVVGGDEFDGDINADGTIDFDDINVEVGADDSVTFKLNVVLKANAPESTLDFSLASSGVTAEGVDSGDDSDVSGSVSSETHTVSTTGIVVDGTGKSSDVDDVNGTVGTFTIEFTVKALEDDVYIYNGANNGDNDTTPFSAMASTTGVAYTIFEGGSATSTITSDSAVLQSSASESSTYFLVEEGETETFTLTVTLAPGVTTAALFSVELDAIRFDDATTAGTIDDTIYVLPNDAEFETTPVSIN